MRTGNRQIRRLLGGDALATRRGFVAGTAKLTGAGALALGGFGAATVGRAALAQDGTPVASPAAGEAAEPNEQMQDLLDELMRLNRVPAESQTPFNARQLPSIANAVQSLLSQRGEPTLEPVGNVEHIAIPTPNGEIIGRVYTPEGQAPFPVTVYYHGGGFVIANLDTYDSSCRALANAAGSVVVSVAYRQAPEAPFPAAVDDAYFAFQYIAENANLVGGDPARIAVAGESAGGNLATTVCLLAIEQGGILPVHQLLVYPLTTFAPEGDETESIETYALAMPLNAALLEYFGAFYLPDATAAADPNASPILAADLSGLPPATIIAAEIDPLLSQGEVYRDALEEADVDVEYFFYEGVTHEFFGTGAVVDEGQEAVAEAAARLTESFEAAASEATPTA